MVVSHNNDGKSFWRRLQRDYSSRLRDSRIRRVANKNLKTDQLHLTVDQLVARRKFEQLKLLTTTDLSITNSAEPYRVSSFLLFKSNLLDPVLCATIAIVYILSSHSSLSTFIISFTCLFLILNYHIESYRSFSAIRENVNLLAADCEKRHHLLNTHLGHNPQRRIKVPLSTQTDRETDCFARLNVELHESINQRKPRDTFHWINRIIEFFWPYLSHVIHYELNEFFRDQIESGLMGRSEEGMKRLFYAIVRQLDTNILLIERCQLGDQAPCIRDMTVSEGHMDERDQEIISSQVKKAKKIKAFETLVEPKGNGTKRDDKTLVYDINFEYSGDMNIAVIYRYLCCCSSRIGLRDVFLNFKLRIALGPFKEDLPFIDQISFTLLDLPKFGYKGIALAELAELRIVRGVINRLIRENILYPHEVSISSAEILDILTKGPDKGQPDNTNKQVAVNGNQEQEVSCSTKLMAKMLLFGCMCSNVFLRSCQKTRTNDDSSFNGVDSQSAKTSDYR